MNSNSSYGSCDGPIQNQSTNNGYTRGDTADKEGDDPRVAVGVTAALLLAGIVLFIAHIHKTPAPVGISQVVNVPLLRNAVISKNEPNDVPDPNAYPRRQFITRNGSNVTLPVLGFPSVALAQYLDPKDQQIANEAVRHAVEDLQISYFDVAPEYGDGAAQERLGPALEPYRSRVFLAAKTMYRDAIGSANDLGNTLKSLKTDHLDLYQFHSISTARDVDQILGQGEYAGQKGALETFQHAKRDGKIKAIGFSAHSEDMAVRMIESGFVDTCMFPINFVGKNSLFQYMF